MYNLILDFEKITHLFYMNMYMCMKINYIDSPFIKFKAMLLSVVTTSLAMPGRQADD